MRYSKAYDEYTREPRRRELYIDYKHMSNMLLISLKKTFVTSFVTSEIESLIGSSRLNTYRNHLAEAFAEAADQIILSSI